jgi:hypothetical protein
MTRTTTKRKRKKRKKKTGINSGPLPVPGLEGDNLIRCLLPKKLIPTARIVCCFTFVGFLLSMPCGYAQTEIGRSVEGRVLTPSGTIVAGAVVQIKDSKTLQIRSFITQTDGRYRFYGLNSNSEYQLMAEKNGSSSGIKTLSMFANRNKAVIDLKMKKDPDSK